MIHEVSCGIIPVRKVGGEYLFLLLRSYNFWCFPKGRIQDGDESELVAALRETEEETTITPKELAFKWGREHYTTEQFKTRIGRKVDKFFVAETDRVDISLPVNPELGKPEHEEYVWVTYDRAKQLVNGRIGKALDWAYNRVIASDGK